MSTSTEICQVFRMALACVAGVRRGGKGERRASEVRKDRTREDRPPFLRPATQARIAWHASDKITDLELPMKAVFCACV